MNTQLLLFPEDTVAKNNSGFSSFDKTFDYEADDAEAVVYMISESGMMKNTALYVMRREDAVRFCSHEKTQGRARGGRWAYAFTTHKRDWRKTPEIFRADDGRFDDLLEELEITTIDY